MFNPQLYLLAYGRLYANHGAMTPEATKETVDGMWTACRWTGTAWFIEGDVADCFGSFDHQAMLSILSEKIHDNRFLRLTRNMLKAGYLEDWTWHATLSGVPQGAGVSTVLSNIYLHKLDNFVKNTLIPHYTRGASGPGTPNTRKCVTRWRVPARKATGKGHACCALGWPVCPAWCPTIPAIADSGTCATAMTRCSDSPGPKPRPRRSNNVWPSSCGTNSTWNCPTAKH
ncbi:reverse transcriptase/maturase family protein [Spirillospora sp. NPDC048911]|uniref:reverse transcriptase/maturase family protein n=1 Tax=Spirillospora sp. NPDC048911 TaxID=3364527 RepID=UPI0037184198